MRGLGEEDKEDEETAAGAVTTTTGAVASGAIELGFGGGERMMAGLIAFWLG